MATVRIDFKGLGETAAEADALEKRTHDAQFAPGPDLTDMACACGAFGPWGEGEARYCAEHAPPSLRFAAQFFAEMME